MKVFSGLKSIVLSDFGIKDNMKKLLFAVLFFLPILSFADNSQNQERVNWCNNVYGYYVRGMSYRDAGLSPQAIYKNFSEYNKRISQPLPEKMIKNIINSVFFGNFKNTPVYAVDNNSYFQSFLKSCLNPPKKHKPL